MIRPQQTIEPVKDEFLLSKKFVSITDTAGIRKRSKIKNSLEAQGSFRALKTLRDSSLIIVVTCHEIGLSHQTKRLIDIAKDQGKPTIIAINKIDTLTKDNITIPHYLHKQKHNTSIINVSALKGTNINKLKNKVSSIINILERPLPTHKLNTCLLDLVKKRPLFIKNHKSFKIRYATQVKKSPLTVMMFTNRDGHIPEDYYRYLESGMRNHFNLSNIPIHFVFK